VLAERVLLGGSGEEDAAPDPEDDKEIGEPRLHARGIVAYDVVSRKYVKSCILDQVPGTMMPIGDTHVVCFCEHPRLVWLESGEVLVRWGDLETGKQVTSILWDAKLPPLAIDTSNSRFAVFGSAKITVIQIDLRE
jgi:hypothetical protein